MPIEKPLGSITQGSLSKGIEVRLHADVSDCRINPPRSFALKFSTGHQITNYDDTPQYESCTIDFEDGLTIVI